MLGAHEYESFRTVFNPECSKFQDFFKFIFVKFTDDFYVPNNMELEEVQVYKQKLMDVQKDYDNKNKKGIDRFDG